MSMSPISLVAAKPIAQATGSVQSVQPFQEQVDAFEAKLGKSFGIQSGEDGKFTMNDARKGFDHLLMGSINSQETNYREKRKEQLQDENDIPKRNS